MYYRLFLKRVLDIIFALLAIILLSPIFLLIILILFFYNKGKVFFTQERPGLNEKPFKIIKFKTMNDETDENGNLLPNHLRITKFGNFLRKTSLDEIPQLFNVLKGDMSLIGPRPLLFKYIPLYSAEQRRRHEVLPGITGLAQVKGRNAISWQKKFEFDIYYVDNISFKLDFEIFLLTLKKVIIRDGVNADDKVTMPPFNGSN